VGFSIGESNFVVQGKKFSQPAPRWLFNIESERLDLLNLFSQLHKCSEAIDVKFLKWNWDSIEKFLKRIAREGEFLEKSRAQVVIDGSQIIIPRLEFEVYNGRAFAQTLVDRSPDKLFSETKFRFERINLAKLQGRSLF